MNKITSFLDRKKDFLSKHEIIPLYDGSRLPSSCSVNLDCEKFVGTIAHWPESLFEFQFISNSTGDTLVSETLEFKDENELFEYIENMIQNKLG